MQYTTNYSLKKPEASDLVSISDLNANADAIDAQLKIIEGKSDAEGVIVKDTTNGIDYLVKFRLINGKPVAEFDKK